MQGAMGLLMVAVGSDGQDNPFVIPYQERTEKWVNEAENKSA